jgi:OOP family OmpA-OmpF porin
LNKILICSAVAAALSANAQAEQHIKDNEKWVAGFVEDYSTDKAETGLPNFLDSGYGAGAEYGNMLTPIWAIRLEISKLDIDASPTDESGSRVGVDALYFMPNDLFYTFGGLKFTEINETDLMANIGLGKHWDLGNSLKIITEVAAYQALDSGDSNTHFGYKLGLAHAFGGSTAQAVHRDGDNDGVMDEQDKCLFTPAGIKVDVSGCELPQVTVNIKDQDQDNVLDEQDKCSDTPILDKVDADGCSLFTQRQYSTNLNVLFENNKSTIKDPVNSQFQEFSNFMNRFPSTDAVVEGHSSAIGEYAYNMWLSKARADAVRTLLINEYGISEVRLTSRGFGESQLLDNSSTTAANIVNRRTVVTVTATTREKVAR